MSIDGGWPRDRGRDRGRGRDRRDRSFEIDLSEDMRRRERFEEEEDKGFRDEEVGSSRDDETFSDSEDDSSEEEPKTPVRTGRVVFVSSRTPFLDEPPRTLLVACCDGRFTAQISEFIENLTSKRGLDRLIVAGGPGAIILGMPNFFAFQKQIRDLYEAHHFTEVIAISHEGCAAYKSKFPNLSDDQIYELQIKHLREFVKDVPKKYAPGVSVSCYYARVKGDRVEFLEIE